MSVKLTQKGAFQLEAGQAGAGQSPGWGVAGSEETLGTGDAYPWLQWPKGKDVSSVDDNSITSEGFKDVPRKVTELVEKSYGMYARFSGLDSFNYWMFGFCSNVLAVQCFVLSAGVPVAGDEYEDTLSNSFVFLRKETWKDRELYVFTAPDGVATGDLSRVSGTGSATLEYSAASDQLYEKLYELDGHERHLTPYRTAEQVTGYSAGDLKNRMATIGIAMGTNDYRYKNAMCKSFNFSSSAGQLAELQGDFYAYDEERGDYSSSGWTYPTERNSSDNIVAHHQLQVELGVSESTLVSLGVTDVNVGVAIPLQALQDTESGTHIAEPVQEGKLDVSCALTLSRHSAETYQDYRDAWTTVVARIAGNYGYDMTEFLVSEATLTQAGPDDSDVSKEPLELMPGFSSVNNWAAWLAGNTLVQNGPLIMRVRNSSSDNPMFEV